MALTLIATAGASDANTFASAARMTAYCEGRLNATLWTAAAAQWPALVEATRDLTNLGYVGEKADALQSLAWPRYNAPDPDPSRLNPVVYLSELTVPERIVDATCELALEYLKAGTTDLARASATEGIKRRKIDVIETEYQVGTAPTRGVARFPRVMALIAPLLGASMTQRDVVRA